MEKEEEKYKPTIFYFFPLKFFVAPPAETPCHAQKTPINNLTNLTNFFIFYR